MGQAHPATLAMEASPRKHNHHRVAASTGSTSNRAAPPRKAQPLGPISSEAALRAHALAVRLTSPALGGARRGTGFSAGTGGRADWWSPSAKPHGIGRQPRANAVPSPEPLPGSDERAQTPAGP